MLAPPGSSISPEARINTWDDDPVKREDAPGGRPGPEGLTSARGPPRPSRRITTTGRRVGGTLTPWASRPGAGRSLRTA